jgi:protein gp37
VADTAIEWTDAVWNPTTGCDRISPGCDNCYALTLAKRLKGMGQAKYQNDGDPRTSGPGFALTVHPDALDLPLRWRKPRRVFVNSMSDLFHKDVADDFICRVFDVMAAERRHTYQVLTKRSQRMGRLFGDDDSVWDRLGISALPNVWLGTSVESDRYTFRADHIREMDAAVRWLSLEPLLGPLPSLDLTGIDWVVAGGESGPGARPMHPDWVRDIRNRCVAAGVPFFFKQWGTWGDLAPLDDQGRYDMSGSHAVANDGTVYAPGDLDWPDGPRRGEALQAGHDRARLAGMYRLGKKAAGRDLDGRTWDQYPEHQ